jgi:hypothetical protein
MQVSLQVVLMKETGLNSLGFNGFLIDAAMREAKIELPGGKELPEDR